MWHMGVCGYMCGVVWRAWVYGMCLCVSGVWECVWFICGGVHVCTHAICPHLPILQIEEEAV